jgi:hypothetical protein
MKNSIRYILPAIACCSAFGLAEEERNPSAPEVTTARVLGNIPDGTPPPPEPPKPRFIVANKNVIDTEIHQQGGREIIVREINPISLPPPPPAASPVDISDPELQQRIADFREEYESHEFLFVGASVYLAKGSPPRTFVSIWPQGQGESVTFWSSADFGLLSGFCSFVGADGIERSLMMAWSHHDLGRFKERAAATQVEPEIPVFPEGKASFVVTSGQPSAATLASIQSLHDLYNTDYDKLKTAYDGRERFRLQHEAELKANPPKPKDIVLNHWNIGGPGKIQGGAK